MKKLYKSEKNKVLSGVLGGVGEYYDIDPTVVRLIFIVIAIVSHIFPALLAYVIAVLVVPKAPKAEEPHLEYVKKDEMQTETKVEEM